MTSSSLVAEKSAQICSVIRSLNEITGLSPKVGFEQLIMSQLGVSPKIRMFEREVVKDLKLLVDTKNSVFSLLQRKKEYMEKIKQGLEGPIDPTSNKQNQVEDIHEFLGKIKNGVEGSMKGVNDLLVNYIGIAKKFLKMMQNQILTLTDLQMSLNDYIEGQIIFFYFLSFFSLFS